jgi:nitroreductase
MDLWEAIKGRKSIRAFKPDPVPKNLLEKILYAATEAISAANMQPWEFVVVGGREKDRLGKIILDSFLKEGKDYDFEGKTKTFPKKMMERREKFFNGLFQKLREQGLEPKKFLQEGTFTFYGAPVVILVFLDGDMGKNAEKRSYVFDIGASVQNLLLAAQAEGLGTHPIGMILKFEDQIKEGLNLPSGKKLVLGICLGYPDQKAPINKYRPEREGLEEVVTWVGL